MPAPVIDVRAQHTIPLGKAFALCLKGIAHRMFRSVLTLTVIVLAVAFFMSLLCEGAFTRAVGEGVDRENEVARFATRRAALWFDEVDAPAMTLRLSGARHGELGEIAAVAKRPADAIAGLGADAAREARILGFFEGMDAGTRAILVRKAKGDEVFATLAPPAAWAEFTESLSHLHALKPPMPLDDFHAAVDRHAGFAADVAALAKSWDESLAALHGALAERLGAADRAGWTSALVEGDAGKLASFQGALAERGFADTHDDVERVHRALARAKQIKDVRDALSTDAARTAWNHEFLGDSPVVDKKMLRLDDARAPKVLGDRWSHEDLAAIAHDLADDQRRLAAEKAVDERLPSRQQPQGVISGRQTFLLAISFVVCMVGIMNAMLMAITERFREIATMKCLGATDGFILNQFLMEASIQGLAGGVAGMLIGGVLSVLKCSVVFGGYLFVYFPAVGVLAAGGICMVAGALLSTGASIYPSWMASRMAPMDAMRIE
jgi:hypothetical protein